MSKLGIIGRGFMFVIVGFVTIIVGSFLLRGNMHMWDKVKKDESKKDKKQRVRRDSNPRPNAPQALALSMLSYEPINLL